MLELKLKGECVLDCSHQGQCDADVKAWLPDPKVAKQLAQYTTEDLADVLRGYGAWDDEELTDRDANLMRVLWIACGNVQEEAREDGKQISRSRYYYAYMDSC